MDGILEKFLKIYPEFKPVLQTDEQIALFDSTAAKIQCIFSEFKDLTKCRELYPFLALTAHYFVVAGGGESIGIVSTQGSGLIASSSVGDVSVSYQSSPYATKGDDFTYFLASTKYGQEYLAWLARQTGLNYVN
jgi:hypothetical protein